MPYTFADFRRDQKKNLPIPDSSKVQGGTYIVTGSNTGLGFECAKHFVKLGAKKVIMAVRSRERGEEAKRKIEAETGKKDIVEVWLLDLASSESVKSFAAKVNTLDRVDAIVENASVVLAEWSLAEGLETTLTVNVVNTYLLAVLALPKLQESAKKFGITSHLVVVGSGVGFDAAGTIEKVDGDVLEGFNQGVMGPRYEISKLLQFYAMRQLAELKPLQETGIVINYLTPGLCRTELNRNVSWLVWAQIEMMRLLFGITAEMGSRNLVCCAVAENESHGKYMSTCEIKEIYVPEWVTPDVQQRVWASLSKRLNEIQPGCI